MGHFLTWGSRRHEQSKQKAIGLSVERQYKESKSEDMNRSRIITYIHNENSRIPVLLSFLHPNPNHQPRIPNPFNPKSEFSAPSQPHQTPNPNLLPSLQK